MRAQKLAQGGGDSSDEGSDVAQKGDKQKGSIRQEDYIELADELAEKEDIIEELQQEYDDLGHQLALKQDTIADLHKMIMEMEDWGCFSFFLYCRFVYYSRGPGRGGLFLFSTTYFFSFFAAQCTLIIIL